MRGGLTLLLLLSGFALAAAVTSELRYGTVRAGDEPPAAAPAAEPPGGVEGVATHAPPRPLRPLEDLSATRERPLFFEDRRYPELPPPVAADEGQESDPVSPEAPADLGPLSVSAIVIDRAERVALIRNTATGEITRMRVGEAVDGWTIEEIEPDAVRLRNGLQRENLTLWNFEIALPAAPSPQSTRERRAERLRALQARRRQLQREAVREAPETARAEPQSQGRAEPATPGSDPAPEAGASGAAARSGNCGLSRC